MPGPFNCGEESRITCGVGFKGFAGDMSEFMSEIMAVWIENLMRSIHITEKQVVHFTPPFDNSTGRVNEWVIGRVKLLL